MEVREYQDALSRQRREEMDEKMHRAEHLRESFLQVIVKKAQAEEAKVCMCVCVWGGYRCVCVCVCVYVGVGIGVCVCVSHYFCCL